jgi:hypothetical protein
VCQKALITSHLQVAAPLLLAGLGIQCVKGSGVLVAFGSLDRDEEDFSGCDDGLRDGVLRPPFFVTIRGVDCTKRDGSSLCNGEINDTIVDGYA